MYGVFAWAEGPIVLCGPTRDGVDGFRWRGVTAAISSSAMGSSAELLVQSIGVASSF